MDKPRLGRPVVTASFFGKILLPFAIPFLVTFALMVLVGDRWPRDIAPGSGLKLAGFLAAMAAAVMVWRLIVRNETDRRVRMFAGVVCLVTGLMGWPVWSFGVLPSINGSVLSGENVIRTTLQRTEATPISKQRGHHHWAWLKSESETDVAFSGRYFISEELYNAWSVTAPPSVELTIAKGILGANVITGMR
jgi:hypothetical protein